MSSIRLNCYSWRQFRGALRVSQFKLLYLVQHAEYSRACAGKKVVRGTKRVTIDIIPGVDDGTTLRMVGYGGADPEGDRPGNLYINVKVREDPIFRREGAHIHVDAVISFTQAILGGTIQVPTLTGDVVLKVWEGTQHGQQVVLKGKGIKLQNKSHYGNQYVHFRVVIPSNLTQRQCMLIEEFAKEELIVKMIRVLLQQLVDHEYLICCLSCKFVFVFEGRFTILGRLESAHDHPEFSLVFIILVVAFKRGTSYLVKRTYFIL